MGLEVCSTFEYSISNVFQYTIHGIVPRKISDQIERLSKFENRDLTWFHTRPEELFRNLKIETWFVTHAATWLGKKPLVFLQLPFLEHFNKLSSSSKPIHLQNFANEPKHHFKFLDWKLSSQPYPKILPCFYCFKRLFSVHVISYLRTSIHANDILGIILKLLPTCTVSVLFCAVYCLWFTGVPKLNFVLKASTHGQVIWCHSKRLENSWINKFLERKVLPVLQTFCCRLFIRIIRRIYS